MLYLSRFYPDLRSTAVRRDLGDPYELHRTLMRAFPDSRVGGPGRVLFRIDLPRDTQQPSLLVQSAKEPDWSRLPRDERGRSYTLKPVEWKPFDPSLVVGQRFRFRLRANPVVKRKSEASEEGKRQALLREEDEIAWLGRKAGAGGFKLESVLVVQEGFQAGTKRGSAITLFAVRFDGVLEIKDSERFRESLTTGIGPAKAFGFGLLSITRA